MLRIVAVFVVVILQALIVLPSVVIASVWDFSRLAIYGDSEFDLLPRMFFAPLEWFERIDDCYLSK